MHTLKLPVYLLIALMMPMMGFSTDEKVKSKMMGDLDFIRNTFRVHYAPLEWKGSYSGWDLEQEIEKCKLRVENSSNITTKEFQKIIKDFFNSVQDYHVSVDFYSTELATLPFSIKGAEGRYFFTYIDRSRLSPSVYPFKEGDEIISINSQPIFEVIKQLQVSEVGKGDTATSHALAEICFPIRVGSSGSQVPKGPIMIQVKPKNSQKISSYQLIWNYTPEKIKGIAPMNSQPRALFAGQKENQSKKTNATLSSHPVFQKKMALPNLDHFRVNKPIANADDLGARKSFVPLLGKKIWESDPFSSFYAYLFENADQKKIGFIRIPHYGSTGGEVDEFRTIIEFLEANSDALIIDQVNNPGGSLFYLYALSSMLTDEPLYAPKHRMSITQKEVAGALEVLPVLELIESDEEAEVVLGNAMDGNPVTYQMVQFFINYFRFILDEWNEGHTCTSPTYLWGIDHIHPHPEVRYTKPILLIVNALDFSGGDFFPAILQDNKRVTVFGAKTAGAGGFKLDVEYPNHFGVAAINYTASLAVRENSEVLENLGVTPDVPYEITANDLQNGYPDYAAAILNALDQILAK